uniref:Uncharacterized protein n=1 Tax=Anguilla anguilla TaxID=7936 RepID=A0A0E9VLG8_ANGAN
MKEKTRTTVATVTSA